MVGTKDFEKRTVLKIFGMNCFTRQLHCYKRAVTFVALAAKPTLNVHCIAYRRVALVNACPTSTALAIIFVSLLGNLTALRAASSKFNESPVLSPSVQSFDSMSQWGGGSFTSKSLVDVYYCPRRPTLLARRLRRL